MGSRTSGFTVFGEIKTVSETPAPVDRHLAIHRQLRALLILSSGEKAAFEDHFARLRREDSASRLVHFSTFSETEPASSDNGYRNNHISSVDHVDQDQLSRWLTSQSHHYDAILPAADLLRRERFSSVDRVIYMGIVAESLGKELGEVERVEETYSRKKGSHSTWVLRCIVHSELDLSNCPFDPVVLAKAIAKNYNKSKHFQPSLTPDPSVTGILGRFFAVVIRHLSIRLALIGPGSSNHKLHMTSESVRSIEGLKAVAVDENCWPTFRVVTEEVQEESTEEAHEGS
ncbi:hypothetical protein [Arthrobacter crystallopoietes]|uniref:hypothetical protein n=1 Tax=Crystallibacter crystallopoietes TaxID=37928 RepID=UPI001ABE23B2|nr:hypothetical protein [Arthrobacter crystallopoietes]QTG81722.1 hypothetical protein J5251_03740 [Arthrobacter crystallopoietes]